MLNKVNSSPKKGKKALPKYKNPLQDPLFPPDSTWTVPEVLPDLSKAKEIAIDDFDCTDLDCEVNNE